MQTKFKPFPEIETKRLLLRNIEVADLDDLFFLRNDDEVNLHLKDFRHSTKEVTLEWLHKIIVGMENEEWTFWVIVSKSDRRFMGTICLWNLSPETNSAEVGYLLHPAFHRQGYMDEALKVVLKYGFEEMDLSFIDAFTHSNNLASVNLLLKNGFLREPKRKAQEGSENICFLKMR